MFNFTFDNSESHVPWPLPTAAVAIDTAAPPTGIVVPANSGLPGSAAKAATSREYVFAVSSYFATAPVCAKVIEPSKVAVPFFISATPAVTDQPACVPRTSPTA